MFIQLKVLFFFKMFRVLNMLVFWIKTHNKFCVYVPDQSKFRFEYEANASDFKGERSWLIRCNIFLGIAQASAFLFL